MSVGPATQSDVDIDIGRLFKAIWDRKALVAGLTVGAAVLAFVVTGMISPLYKSESRVLIETREPVYSSDQTQPQADAALLDERAVTSQVEILRSVDLVKQVARELDLSSREEFDPAANISALSGIMITLGLKKDPHEVPADERILNPSFANRWDFRERVESLSTRPRRFRSARYAHSLAMGAPLYPIILDSMDKISAGYHLEARYPFFDRRLMQFCLSLPVEQKLSRGWGRWIMRRAMKDALPEEVRWRSSKAGLSPNFLRGMRQSARATLEALVADGECERIREIFNVDALRALIDNGADHDWNLIFNSLSTLAWLSLVEEKPNAQHG